MKMFSMAFGLFLILLAISACSGKARQEIEIDQVLLNWSNRPIELSGEVVLRNGGEGIAAGRLELICELDLDKIETKALETFVGKDAEGYRELLEKKEELNPLLETVLRYIEEEPDSGLRKTWDVRLKDPEKATYVFSLYVEVNLLPGEVDKLSVSSPVPGYLYGRQHSLTLGSLKR